MPTIELTAATMPLTTDPAFWALISLILFFAILIWKQIPAKILKQLDQRSAEISRNLDDARNLREQAQSKLAEAERLHEQAEKDAANILQNAADEAGLLAEKSALELADKLKRRENMAARRLERIEKDAVRKIQQTTAAAAANAAETMLRKQMNIPEIHNNYLQTALKQAQKTLKNMA